MNYKKSVSFAIDWQVFGLAMSDKILYTAPPNWSMLPDVHLSGN